VVVGPDFAAPVGVTGRREPKAAPTTDRGWSGLVLAAAVAPPPQLLPDMFLPDMFAIRQWWAKERAEKPIEAARSHTFDLLPTQIVVLGRMSVTQAGVGLETGARCPTHPRRCRFCLGLSPQPEPERRRNRIRAPNQPPGAGLETGAGRRFPPAARPQRFWIRCDRLESGARTPV
jgi:hypothetical protein